MYASAAQFIQRYKAQEIAGLADPGVPPLLDGELLSLAVAGSDLSAYTAEAQDAAAAALAKIQRALQDAEQTINSYLAGRYQLPLSNAPEVLERIAGQLARYFLYDDNPTDQVKELYKDSLKFLEGVSTGKVQLGTTDSGSTAQPAATAEMVSDGRTFGRDQSRGFI